MIRNIRYQAAIIHDRQILLIQHREHASKHSYWLLPGGGREADETPEQCVVREVQEETGLGVRVERLLLDDPAPPGDTYQRFHTYLCEPSTFAASPGMEPEPEASAVYAITAVDWLPLDVEANWNPHVLSDPLTAPLLRRIRHALGDTQDVVP
jgi:8-oxo-dGTP pyrophosphatase MutT (NUDIX family)